MKKLVFAAFGAAALALAGCSGDNQDAVGNAEVNQAGAEDLNALAADAANDAANAEAEALANQQAQLENVTEDNTSSPTDADEQNVSGM